MGALRASFVGAAANYGARRVCEVGVFRGCWGGKLRGRPGGVAGANWQRCGGDEGATNRPIAVRSGGATGASEGFSGCAAGARRGRRRGANIAGSRGRCGGLGYCARVLERVLVDVEARLRPAGAAARAS